MFTTIDEKNGVVKTQWDEVRSKFQKVDPHLSKLIDAVSPNQKMPIYLIYFPYGMLKGDTKNSYLPLCDGGHVKLSDSNINKEISKDLSYGMNSSPLGIILDKHIEYFSELDDQLFPFQICGPGTIFNKGILLKNQSGRSYSPNGILKATSGARTAFMLPSINNHNGINKLSKLTNKELTTPRRYVDHFDLFVAINQYNNQKWKSCLAYFSESWVTHLRSDPAWIEIKNYILEGKNINDSFSSNSEYYDIFYSKVQKDRNLRISMPYLTNTAIHLIKIALGKHPGYIPAITENLLPLENIQKFISDAFQLRKIPTVMIPHSLIYENEKEPVYYSMQNPTTPHCLIKKNERVTANQEIDIVHRILSKFVEEMSKSDSLLSGTVFSEISDNIIFNYFHNYPPKDNSLINNSRNLAELDPRFTFCFHENNSSDFSFEGQFLRGCIQIQPINNNDISIL
ncbi:Uncharacterised protein [Legionella steigerwaltii]|uniref:Uncharacterized protein n=1 Tax=Legionella steigerwaltii TaxID=460 RepID=A0A378LAM7_9GAMM|nr:hypothetical protein [Legionella steigerwaltii]KTD78546.1 hypothetical protein Lstg_1281 [Legionella steigerwaltii]STY24095.1 Uncharacterised protein [Legionella steigerwaltii]